MLQVVSRAAVRPFCEALRALFVTPNHQIHRRHLTDPGGGSRPRNLLWLPDPGLWAYISATPQMRRSRWFCWFGTTLGEPHVPLTPSIEINLAVDPGNRRAGGRALISAEGQFLLGHKGMLGGGRGGQMTMVEFARRIRGFVPEEIALPDQRKERAFVIGALAEPDLLSRLRSFVLECERLRRVARGSTKLNRPARNAQRNNGGLPSFSPEADADGTGSGYSRSPQGIRRLHGRVVNALHEKLGKRAINSMWFEMKPDLYILDEDGRLKTLFEVKASSDTQSWFTALGQLVVYGAGQSPPPKRVLVCPAPRKDPNFQKALAELKVDLILFEEMEGKICFPSLSSFLT